MSNNHFGKSTVLRSLEAENKHLKNILSKFVKADCKSGFHPYPQLIADIEALLHQGEDVETTLQACIKQIGECCHVDRISFFSFDEQQQAYIAQQQWVNGKVQEYHPGELTITADENPLIHSNSCGCFVSNDLKSDLSLSLSEKFEIFNVASLLIVPVELESFKNGMMVLESCLFSREWYPFEIDTMQQVAGFMSFGLNRISYKNRVKKLTDALAQKEEEYNERFAELMIQNKDLALGELLLKEMLDALSPIVLITEEAEIKYVNKPACAILGSKSSELLKEKISSIVHPDALSEFEEAQSRVLGGNEYTGRLVFCLKNGDEVEMEMTGKLLRFDKQRYGCFALNVCVDVKQSSHISANQLKVLNEELVLAKENAERSDRLKSEFLSNISHELRTPLNAIVGFSSLLKDSKLPPGEVDDYVDVILKNSDSLMELVNNIIDVAKIESGSIAVVKQKVNLTAQCNELNDIFLNKVALEHKGRVRLICSLPEGGPYHLDTDPARLRQVLVNLIGNAIKFTLKGFVEFGFSLEKDAYRFFVRDTGIGISKAKQQVIFKPFSKGQESEHNMYQGTGIGLAICEKLVNALGGEIGLESDAGKGAEFFFTHPINDVPISNKKQIFKLSTPLLPKKYYWPNKMMLLVDENSSTHLQMRKYIEDTGITLISARTVAGASKLLMNRKDIHLVLMDRPFSDSDGDNLVDIIKQLNKNMPVVLHTENADSLNPHDMGKNFDACITKPAPKDDLLTLLDGFLVEGEN
ncbi:PAS domain S-box-containing protein [Saccharicrinis carchari]|uniref:histidine kinase n=1 Tax=Saccharicrinis carchari TaxID=1168039 RepID=A0A521D988_SACCC|nr:ATP-binding protein [Saccharicrinis carchari]SMO67450.1 PAS domain S-box-containing protein [Saccharicrinis carchari]